MTALLFSFQPPINGLAWRTTIKKKALFFEIKPLSKLIIGLLDL